MTLILLAPISVSVTVNSVFSSTGGRGAAAAAHRHRHRHRRRRGHAQFRLERLHELRQLEDADSLDVFDHLLLASLRPLSSPALLRLWIRSDTTNRIRFLSPNAKSLGLTPPLLLLRLHQHTHQIARRGVQHADDLHHRRLQHEQQLRVAAPACPAAPPAR